MPACPPQVAKVVLPIWYGSQYQCSKLPRDAFLRGLRLMDAMQPAGSRGGQPQAPPVAVSGVAQRRGGNKAE
jgi:hypothetical protein